MSFTLLQFISQQTQVPFVIKDRHCRKLIDKLEYNSQKEFQVSAVIFFFFQSYFILVKPLV